jgi:trimethylamine--corrinoid protein Co-methyltransferase
MTSRWFRKGTVVQPQSRISEQQIRMVHKASMGILDDPGLLCFSRNAAEILEGAGCELRLAQTGPENLWRIRFPETVVRSALEQVPWKVELGARKPENRLILDAHVPRVYFGTGSETNIFLHSEMAEFEKAGDPSVRLRHPVFREERGTVRHLCASAKICDALENVDFFIRNVNLQDPDIGSENKDVNVFLASLMHTTKHVQAGLTRLESLDGVLRLAEIVAGGPEALMENPLVSFITCLVKSPLQMVEDTTEKLIAVASRGLPVVISSSPQGGSTAPIREEGMVAMINAEILAGITLAQAVNPGTPVLYGAVPVRVRLDTLHDLYGAPEFVHYNVDCAQMARHYGVPCYSTAGVGDSRVPGLQAVVEKLFSYLGVASSGAQYIHYAFGLLDKTNVFSPLQAVLDDACVGVVRQILRPATFNQETVSDAVREVRKVLDSSTGLFARHIRKAMRRGLVSSPFPLEGSDGRDEVMEGASQRLEEILAGPGDPLDAETLRRIGDEVEGVLPAERFKLPAEGG